MNNLPNEMIILISSFLNNKENLIFVKTCKYYNKILYKYGFLKSLYYTFPGSIVCFTQNFIQHNRTLTDIYINNGNNIHLYMSSVIWPKRIKFMNYNFNCEINTDMNTNTENLYITTYQNKLKMYINWSKFNKLKYLFLHIYDLDFTNIELCTNLEVIFIYLEISNNDDRLIIIPKNIGLLKNLKHLLTNCNLSIHTNFISEKLQTCISNNNHNNINILSSVIKSRNYYTDKSLDCLYDNLCI